ncbi:MAG TPA: YetF domain-containing protein [Sphingomicrobium sp.]|nr:YetF domain-containing protein [Sphingomicrobium sp.]
METVIRGAGIYFFLMLILRASGRRTLAEITPFDFVLLLIIAETTQQALLGEDYSISNAIVLIVTLIGLDIFLSHVMRWWPAAGRLLEGVPTVLVRDGKIDRRALERSRIGEEEILVAARQRQGLENLSQIKHAVLETDSGISIIPKER